MYMDKHFNVETFYWRPVDGDHFSWNWPELSDFFNSTKTQDIKDISYDILEKFMLKRQRGK